MTTPDFKAPQPAPGRMPAGAARALIARLTAAVRGDDGDEIEAAMTAVSDALQRPWDARFSMPPGIEPTAYAVFWGVLDKRPNSVHIGRQTALDVAATIKSPTEIRPLYASPVATRQLMDAFNGEGWRKECADTDALLMHLGLEPETCRTDGGWLNLPRIKSLLGQCCEKAGGPGRVCADCATASSAYSADMARGQA